MLGNLGGRNGVFPYRGSRAGSAEADRAVFPAGWLAVFSSGWIWFDPVGLRRIWGLEDGFVWQKTGFSFRPFPRAFSI
jgi:hypothetical protein